MSHNKIKKNFIWNAIGSTVYAFTSLFFMIIVTRINGTDDAGIFTFAFSFASMLQVIVFYGTRAYQVTERDTSIRDCDFIYFKIMSCIVMVIVALIFCAFRQYDLIKFAVIMLLVCYRALDGFSDVFYAIFQKNENLYQVGVSFCLRSLFCTLVFFTVDLISKDLIIACIALLVSDIIVFIVYDFVTLKKYSISFIKINTKSLKKILIGGFAVCIFYLMSQYLINIQKYFIDFLLDNNTQTIFGIILMPATFMGITATFIINPFLTRINDYLKNDNYFGFNKLISRICLYVVIIGVFVVVCCCIVGVPILNFIYGLNLWEYFWPLQLVVVGSIFQALVAVLSNSLIAVRKNKQQTYIYLFVCIFSTIITMILISNYYLEGATLSFTLTMFVLLLIYWFYFKKLIRSSISRKHDNEHL